MKPKSQKRKGRVGFHESCAARNEYTETQKNHLPMSTSTQPANANSDANDGSTITFAPDFMPSLLCINDRVNAGTCAALEELHAFLKKNFKQFELIFIDNDSPEDAQGRLLALLDKNESIRYIRLARRYSPEIASTCAIDQAIGDVGVVFDLEMDVPESILPLAQSAAKGNIAIAKENRHNGFLRKFLARLFYRLLRKIGGVKFNLGEGLECAYPRAALTALNKIKNKRRNLRFFHSFIGIPQELIEVPRKENRRRESLRTLVGRSMDLLFSNFIQPLKWVSWLGCGTAFLNLLYLGYILIISLIKESVAEGWISNSITTTVMFFVLFLILSVIAEYIGRILEEVQDRPLYFIDFEKDSRMDLKDKIINVV
jgi:dolichol-phosphate mannosyltransferase